jgi:GntR family transcriptional repressor for pyruvate dehydrogenase complex
MSDAARIAKAEHASRRPKLSDILYTDILRKIQAGMFSADGRLPSEKELALRFGVSRPIVRQTLLRLRDEGLIYSRQGSGSFVRASGGGPPASHSPTGNSSPEEVFRPVQSIADVQKLYEFRISVEGEIAYAAAIHRTDTDVANISAALLGLEDAIATGELGASQDFDFHDAIARATQSELFHSVITVIQPHLRFVIDLSRSLSRLGSAEHLAVIQREHAAIYEAVRDRNPEAARLAARTHISNARERVFNGIVR